MTHTTHTCQYIGGDGYKPSCTHAALAGYSYCAEHLAVVYKQGTKRATRLMNEAILELETEGFDCYGDSERIED
jgi:hypothetical protein